VQKTKKKQFSPKKLALITEIIVTIMKARMIFLEACNLLLTSPGAGEIEDFNGSATIKGRLASLFFYSHSELYTEFVKNIFYKYMQKKANILSNLAETTVGILAKRERDPSLTIPNYIQNGVFFFGGEKFRDQNFSFVLHDKKTNGIRRLELGICRDFFKDFHSVKYDDETYDPEGLQIDCLEGMGTLFDIFTTENINNIYITKELEAFRNRTSPLFKEIISKDWKEPSSFGRGEAFKSEALSSIREMVLDIKKAFSEKEELLKPEVFVDKEIVEISVKAAAKTKNLNFLNKAKGWRGAYLLKGLPQTGEFNNRLKKMDNRYLLRNEYKTTNTVLPGFVVGFSLQTKKIKSPKMLELSFHQTGYILVNTKNKGEKRFKESAYRDRDWAKEEEELEDDNFGALANIVKLTAFLRELDLSTLKKLKKEIALAEDGATTIFRFFNATRNLCKVQLLLKNI
jgi:hypothetical protein